ncbi:cobyric acid synthase [Desulfonatronovibrio magnus]|uniref:cobyric acid synthase n=1 Tax=Desulfonatronovibrio magnus TaxID=698827 RepID=UPI0005EB78A8|nr:cobyric acid synthase [Desulfonatronovibrio magnus]
MSLCTKKLIRSHGGEIYSAAKILGCDPKEITDFSSSINPFGPPDSVYPAIASSLWNISSYPDPFSTELINSAARRFKIPPQNVCASNGATEIIDLLPSLLDVQQVVIPCPAYNGYREAAQRFEVHHKLVFASNTPESIFPGLDEIKSSLSVPSLIFIGRPNNPTSHMPDVNMLMRLASEHPDSYLIIDESFLNFVPDTDSLIHLNLPNVVIIYSLTKFFSIPGLRLGLAMGPPDIISGLAALISGWSVNVFAQAAGKACLEDDAFINKNILRVNSARKSLLRKLQSFPQLATFHPQANFILCRLTDSQLCASELKSKLLKNKILIRSCEDFDGLDASFFRLAVKSEEDQNKLVQSLSLIFRNDSYFIRRDRSKTPSIMIQGTSSGAGKSLICAALCRILYQDGVKVAPFKSQNMSLNSFVTRAGHEMGRAQVVQARACGLDPDARMNPVLLKPNSDTGSQVIVMGKPAGNMNVDQYITYKKELFEKIKSIYDEFAAEFEVIILEGAGSPAEINLKSHDLVNMNMAGFAESKVLLTGDIDRGGVFASFAGTIQMLEPWEKEMVSGLIINKFRGQKNLLQSAIDYTTIATAKPCLGVIPYVYNLTLPEEDSVTFKNHQSNKTALRPDSVHIGILDLPHISNFTDFDPLYCEPDVNITIIRTLSDIPEDLDVLLLPGSKNVPSDFNQLKISGLANFIKAFSKQPDKEVFGICAGLQMLGLSITDYHGLESSNIETPGLGLLPIKTGMMLEKTLRQVHAKWIWSSGEQADLTGYEIHHGRTRVTGSVLQPITAEDDYLLGVAHPVLHISGTYLHGIFDADQFRRQWIDKIRTRKGLTTLVQVQSVYDIDLSLNRLAEVVRENIDMREIYRLLKIR